MFKPETNDKPKYDPLPEGQYPFVVVAPDAWVVDKPDWKLEYDLEAWNKREAEKENGRPLESTDDLPFYKKQQIQIPMVVREGEYKGRRLPTLYVGVRFNTDPKYMEKANWYKLLRCIVPDLKKRAAEGDIPDFDTEVVGYGATADVEVTDKGRNKVVGYAKDGSFGKRLSDAKIAELLLGATEVAGEGDAEIPF